MQRTTLCVAVTLSVFLANPAARATTIHVPGEQPNIQAGVSAAAAGDTVLLAPGTYVGDGNWDVDIATAGIILGSEGGADVTVIDCQGQGPAVTVSALGDTSTVIYGLTFTGCVGDYQHAGAIYLLRPAAVRDCVFEGNQGGHGAAIKLWSGGTFLVDGCVFKNNSVSGGGGAISNNWCMLLLRDSVFWNNSAGSDGGAMFFYGGSCRTYGCTFVANSAPHSAAIGLSDITVQQLVVTRSIIAFSSEGLGLDDEFAWTDVSHCCVFSNAGGDDLPEGSHDNMFVDPRLCGMDVGDVSLCADSPCLPSSPDNPWATLVGALDQGCDACESPVEESSWGVLKALFSHGRE